MHRFVSGGYLLQATKERMLLNTSKKDICKCKGKSGPTGYTPYLEGLGSYLHNGILRSREKEGAYTLCKSMDGTGEHYAK